MNKMQFSQFTSWLAWRKFKRALAEKQAAKMGARGTSAYPTPAGERMGNYAAQNGTMRLTAKQRRRTTKKFNRAMGRLK